jgi:hypothetical protein
MSEQDLQRPVTTRARIEPPVKEPFKPESPELLSQELAKIADGMIPSMGAEPASLIKPKPTLVEEQYQPSERRALDTSTTETHYDLLTPDPKQILLIAETQDHFVDFNRSITDDSPKIFASGSLSMTGKGIVRIYTKTVTGTGTLRILVFKA